MLYRVLGVVLMTFAAAAFGQTNVDEAMSMVRTVAARAPDYYPFPSGAQSSLVQAAASNDSAAVDDALRAGANLDFAGEHGISPLLWLLLKQEYGGFVLLLERGAAPNLVTVNSSSLPENVVHSAAMLEDSRYLRAALEHGGNPNLVLDSRRTGYAPIHAAIRHRRPNNIKLLLSAGADIDHRDVGEGTPLLYAAAQGQWSIALLLLESGADASLKNRYAGVELANYLTYGPRHARDSADYAAFEGVAEILKRTQR